MAALKDHSNYEDRNNIVYHREGKQKRAGSAWQGRPKKDEDR
jgi:hypothetical protein